MVVCPYILNSLRRKPRLMVSFCLDSDREFFSDNDPDKIFNNFCFTSMRKMLSEKSRLFKS
ncbi:hypothetical protein BpHYR1_028711 [Brachionus plicatilis]|uniref:Uncharacterized protein n=1 Tax=Brachionus plicatilis TaxID=10195 RepID=A0A3M7Q3S2_BRAPC|nr:hypothetical protein BpHYR1_028711 [Brachionus plicatilis]